MMHGSMDTNSLKIADNIYKIMYALIKNVRQANNL